ncbi:MAG: polyphosphate kinase [Chloroflexota bacterium]|nr:polyphosphate kinase [Chloroflexota bacterium]
MTRASTRASRAATGASRSPAANGRRAAGARANGIAASTKDGAPGYINRELSWLEFNSRVLALAEDTAAPLLERAKFLAIVSQNLDEFFQVRVAGLKEQVGAGVATTAPDGLSAPEQLRGIRDRVRGLVERQVRLFEDDVAPRLREAGISIIGPDALDEEEAAWLLKLFKERIFPVLTPLAVDPAHPFPYISNLSLNLAVQVRDPVRRRTRFARVKVPPILPRFFVMPDGARFIPLEQVIATHLDTLFPGMRVVAHHPFRVTRNADLDLEEDEADDLLAAIETELRRSRRFADVVRLEVDPGMSDEVRSLLTRELELEDDDVYVCDGLLDHGGLWDLHRLERPDLKDPAWPGAAQARLAPGPAGGPPNYFRVLREGDVLVHHPYESFATSVEGFIEQASRDADVLAIKQTLYRTSGPEGGIMRALIRAAERGKQVVALVELKARFDERANIAWARALEEAGVHVVYGLVGLKTHAKTTLVLRREQGAIKHYVHIGTGNYNPVTATVYEDIGLMSTDPVLGSDLAELFNYLTGYSRQRSWRRLVVAPVGLRVAILELIEREASAPDGRVIMKMNSLVDEEVINALYAASQAGCEVDLVTRGICCLRPGVPGRSENIRVRSIVGRYLEHSRIYRFGSEARGVDYYVGSADMMPRNLDRRVEVLVPVVDHALKERLGSILETNLQDDTLAWTLNPDATWTKVPTVEGVNTHLRLQADVMQESQPAGTGA